MTVEQFHRYERVCWRAQLLVWLNIDWPTCKERLLSRGSISKRHLGRAQSEQGLRELIDWASRYYERAGLRSLAGHKSLFERFPETRVELQSEADVLRWLNETKTSSD